MNWGGSQRGHHRSQLFFSIFSFEMRKCQAVRDRENWKSGSEEPSGNPDDWATQRHTATRAVMRVSGSGKDDTLQLMSHGKKICILIHAKKNKQLWNYSSFFYQKHSNFFRNGFGFHYIFKRLFFFWYNETNAWVYPWANYILGLCTVYTLCKYHHTDD